MSRLLKKGGLAFDLRIDDFNKNLYLARHAILVHAIVGQYLMLKHVACRNFSVRPGKTLATLNINLP